MVSVEEARELARGLLEEALPRRWVHSKGVARQARTLAPILSPEDLALVEAAAWLHDIGYAPPLVVTGFHPLDGARYLRDLGFGEPALWTLVANHTGADSEAAERGLGRELVEEFPARVVSEGLRDCLTYCDLTTGPDGGQVSVEQRLAEILARYPADDVVHRAVSRSQDDLRRISHRVEAQLLAAGAQRR